MEMYEYAKKNTVISSDAGYQPRPDTGKKSKKQTQRVYKSERAELRV